MQEVHLVTKIRGCHIQGERENMKVKVDTQSLSHRVSVVLDYLREDLKLPEFEECNVEFILKFNNLFDIFNSQTNFAVMWT